MILSPSYTKDSAELQWNLLQLHPQQQCITHIGTSDAKSMYTNIDPEEGIDTIERYINTFSHELKGHFPRKLIMKLLKLVMTTSVFQFGNTWWQQMIGTAMGTPCACSYATLFFAYYERMVICPKYKNNLIFYKRYIDDIFFVWKHDSANPNAFADFQTDLSAQCKLEWITENLSNKVDFLDLSISIDEGRFTFKTFQKAMNLYLYIPSHSAHTPGLLKSLIYGLVTTYHRQNSLHADFLLVTKLLYDRLIARGHKQDTIEPIFLEVATIIDHRLSTRVLRQQYTTEKHQRPEKRLFFHLPFHPKDISRQQIRNMYETTCETPDKNGESMKVFTTDRGSRFGIENMTIAYHRPKNLRDLLSPSKLKETPSLNVKSVLKELKGSG